LAEDPAGVRRPVRRHPVQPPARVFAVHYERGSGTAAPAFGAPSDTPKTP